MVATAITVVRREIEISVESTVAAANPSQPIAIPGTARVAGRNSSPPSRRTSSGAKSTSARQRMPVPATTTVRALARSSG